MGCRERKAPDPSYAASPAGGSRVVQRGRPAHLTACADGTVRIWDADSGEPLTPATKLEPYFAALFDPHVYNSRCLTLKTGPAAWDLPRSDRPAADLVDMAHLRGAYRVDATGGLVPLRPAELGTALHSLQEKYPADFALRELQGASPGPAGLPGR